MSERIQKVLANLGHGSRREIEGWITEGRIKINNNTAKLGDCVTATDHIHIDGRHIKLNIPPSNTRVLLYYKPEGEVVSRNDPENRPTVFDKLPPIKNARWISIGRLDINSSGLLLLTNDGELANKLMHPKNNLEREYSVRVFGEVTHDILNRLKEGVKLDDGMSHFQRIKAAGGQGLNRWYNVVLNRGRNREVRRLWESQGLRVSRLIRVRYGDIKLPRKLTPGTWEELKEPLSDL